AAHSARTYATMVTAVARLTRWPSAGRVDERGGVGVRGGVRAAMVTSRRRAQRPRWRDLAGRATGGGRQGPEPLERDAVAARLAPPVGLAVEAVDRLPDV